MLENPVVEALGVLNTPEIYEKLVSVATAEVPLPKRMLLAVKALAPVPPLATGNIPETSAVKETEPMFNSPPMLLTTPVPREERVVEPEGAMVNKAAEVEEATWKGLRLPARPTTVRLLAGVVVFMPIRPDSLTIKKERPEEEAILKGSKAGELLRLKEMVEEVAFWPATVLLSMRVPLVAEVEEAQTIT